MRMVIQTSLSTSDYQSFVAVKVRWEAYAQEERPGGPLMPTTTSTEASAASLLRS